MSRLHVYKLQNNLPVIFVPDSNISYISIAFKVRAGSNYETANQIGAAHLTEHLMLSQNNELIQQYGGRVGGVTSRDEVLVYIKILKEYFKEAVEYLSVVLLDKNSLDGKLEIQKNIVIQEIKRSLSNPEKIILRRSYKTLYPNTRMEILNTGEIENIENISMEEIKEFRNKHYNSSNSVVCITGDIKKEEVEMVLSKYLSKLPKGRCVKEPKIEVEEGYKNKLVTQVIKGKYNQKHIKVDFYGFKNKDKERHALHYLAYILNTRLDKVIRQDKGLAYTVNAKDFCSTNYGIFSIYTATNNKKVLTEISDVLCELESIINGIDLEILQRNVISETIFNLEKPSQIIDFYTTNYLCNNLITPEEEIDNYKHVTKEDILRVYRYIANQKQKVTILG